MQAESDIAGPDATHASGTAGARLMWRAFALCALVALADGFDTQSIGPAARSMAATLGVEASAFGLVFAASQLGFLVGAAIFGTLGDRFGRKRSLILTSAIFALASLATAFVGSFGALVLLRAMAGVGLGGASPNFISLASEHAPPEQRARIVTWLWAAVPLGGMAGSFASSALLPTFGWPSIFLVGGIAPLLLLPVLAVALPESLDPLLRNKAALSLRQALVDDGRLPATLWLWLASFMTWTTLVVTALWTPLLLQSAGWSDSGAALVLALNNAGGVIGVLVTGALLAWLSAERALLIALTVTGVAVAAIGLATATPALLPAAVLVAGVFASAAGGAVLAVSAGLYLPAARATGVGWALGFGRIGTILGPAVIGFLVARQWPAASIYGAIAVVALTGAVCVRCLMSARRHAAARRRAPLSPSAATARCRAA